MNVSLESWTQAKSKSNMWIIPVFSGRVPAAAKRFGFTTAQARAWGFDGAARAVLPVSLAPGGQQALLLGMGVARQLDVESVRRAMALGVAGEFARKTPGATWVIDASDVLESTLDRDTVIEALAESAALSTYAFTSLKRRGTPEAALPRFPKRLIIGVDRVRQSDRKTFKQAIIMARWTNWARDLLAQSQSHLTAVDLARMARSHAQKFKSVQCRILGQREIAAKKMGLLQAVNQGSTTPARFIVLKYNGGRKSDAPVCLIGKGLTYDTGGYNLKPGESMRGMHMDKGGGVAALSAFFAAVEMGLDVNLVCLVPSTDNRISGSAMVAGDVFVGASGISVEVDNTDAEGRLILADALAYAKQFKPGFIIDMATLTGAAVVAVGDRATAVFCNDDSFAEGLLDSGAKAGELAWRMPLWSAYEDKLKSHTADIKNVGGRWGGAITAALFLRRFVPEGVKWAHLDIAGRTKVESAQGCFAAGTAYGFGPRLLCRWLRTRRSS